MESDFRRNVIFVFIGTALVNVFNLLFQLLIAHSLSPSDFAAFNALLSIFLLFSSPLSTFQPAVAKYTSELKAVGENDKIKELLSALLKSLTPILILTLAIFLLLNDFLVIRLKIGSISSGYVLALLVAASWIAPVLAGGLQGMELFGWLVSSSIISGALKLTLGFLFIWLGYSILGAMAAFLISFIIGVYIYYLPLKKFITFKTRKDSTVDLKKIFAFLFPVMVSTFCYIALTNFDMIMAKYFFQPEESGFYSLAQMVGKIFLFLPGAIGVVMFPRSAGLNAKNLDSTHILKKSIFYAAVLCLLGVCAYNIFPSLVLKALVGKVFANSVNLGRLFSISMSMFALLNILILYFLSIKDLRFIYYLAVFTLFQIAAIWFYHPNPFAIQAIMCVNSFLLLIIHLALAFRNKSLTLA
jgi:O-antigen/teichoic acid export membrane protein